VVGVLADKYDEEFEAFFPTFAGDVWALLSGASSARIMAESMDPLVIKAVRFLTASVNSSVHAAFFKVRARVRASVPACRYRACGDLCGGSTHANGCLGAGERVCTSKRSLDSPSALAPLLA
jgi:hypothetical protein